MSITKRKLAVFDIDGTIFRASLARSLFYELIKAGIFPKRAAAEVQPEYDAWVNRQGHYDTYINKLVEVFQKYIKGVEQKKLRALSKKVVAAEKMRVYRFTRDLIVELKKKNYFIVAISGSPWEIVRWYNRFLRFNKTYGSVLGVDARGRYTGKLQYAYSVFEKDLLVKHVVKKYGVTLRGSVAVGDTESDISMLEMVDRPIAFNPSSGLYKIAKRKGWEIVVERKDVIYKI